MFPQLAHQQHVPGVLLAVAGSHEALYLLRGRARAQRRSGGRRRVGVADERDEHLVAPPPVRLRQARDVHSLEQAVRHRRRRGVRHDSLAFAGRRRSARVQQRRASHERGADDGEVLQLGREELREELGGGRGEARARPPGPRAVPRHGLGEKQHAARAPRVVRGHQARLHASQQVQERHRPGVEQRRDRAQRARAIRLGRVSVGGREHVHVLSPRGGRRVHRVHRDTNLGPATARVSDCARRAVRAGGDELEGAVQIRERENAKNSSRKQQNAS